MDEGQLPSGGWFWVALAAAALVGRAVEYPITWLASFLGWRKAKDAEREHRLTGEVHALVMDKVNVEMSEIRQHIAAIQKGLEGKQAVIEDKINGLRQDMLDRDDKLEDGLHERISAELARHETRMTGLINRQVDLVIKAIARNGSARR